MKALRIVRMSDDSVRLGSILMMRDIRQCESRVLVVIPAWNEEAALPLVLGDVRSVMPGVDLLVVDDGSTDHTSEVAASFAVPVLKLPFNLGVGGAMRAGLKYARDAGYDIAIQLDADGQHDPSEIAALIEPVKRGDSDVVIGSRFTGKGTYSVRGPRRWAMRFLSAVISRAAHVRLDDTTSGFKAYGSRAIAIYSRDYPAEYLGDTVESLVIGIRSGLTIDQVPVHMRPRAGGQASHNPFKAAVFLVRAFFALVIAWTRPRAGVPTLSEEKAS